eukprot:SAG31_NODE_4916_length_2869_cov_3.648375_3_plen_106_part_00
MVQSARRATSVDGACDRCARAIGYGDMLRVCYLPAAWPGACQCLAWMGTYYWYLLVARYAPRRAGTYTHTAPRCDTDLNFCAASDHSTAPLLNLVLVPYTDLKDV